MNRIHCPHHILRTAGILASLASALLASITTATAAFATTSPGPLGPAGLTPVNLPPPPGWDKHPRCRAKPGSTLP